MLTMVKPDARPVSIHQYLLGGNRVQLDGVKSDSG